jgi:hypothetical protein
VTATIPTDAGSRFQIGDSRLSAKGSKTPIVMKEGLMAYEVTYPANARDKSNMNITFAQPGYFPSTQARFRFKIFPDPAWPFSGTPSGKLAGFAIGKGASSGGHYSTNGASMRLTWDANGGLSPYMYPELHQPLNTLQSKVKLTIPQLDQDPSFLADVPKGAQSGISPAGTHMWHPRKGGQNSYALAFVRGQWNQIEMYVRLNAVQVRYVVDRKRANPYVFRGRPEQYVSPPSQDVVCRFRILQNVTTERNRRYEGQKRVPEE